MRDVLYRTCRVRCLGAAAAIAACLAVLAWAGPARGATPTNWTYDGAADWSELARWSYGFPSGSKYAMIEAGVIQITSPVSGAYNMYVDDSWGVTFATVELRDGGSLAGGNEYIGWQSAAGGAFHQWGGTNTASQLVVGTYAGARGEYIMADGTLTVGPNFALAVGSAGSGTFNQMGGTVVCLDQVLLGWLAGATGRYDMSGGTLDTQNLYVRRGTFSLADSDADLIVHGQMQFEPEGTLLAAPGTTVRMVGRSGGAPQLANTSSNPDNCLGLNNIEFAFGGGTDRQAVFEIASADMGLDPAGYVGNFAIDALHVGGADGAASVRLLDNVSNQPGSDVLYARRIIVEPGSTLDLSSRKVYAGELIMNQDAQGQTGTLLNAANLAMLAPASRFGKPIASGDSTFQVDAGTVFGDGLVEVVDLSATHRLSASASGSAAPVRQTNSITRLFTFQRDDGLSDPATVYLGGWLDGLLEGESSGEAAVEASFTLKDASGNPIGGDDFRLVLTSPGDGSDSADVHELLSFDALLTPGETYQLSSTVTVEAVPNGGAAQALFDNSWDVAISGTPIPEPATLSLLALGALSLVRRRRR